MKAPFPYFGGKSAVAAMVWQRLGAPSQYIEPFCGSATMLLNSTKVASLCVSPPPKRLAGHQLQEVLVIEGMCERVIMRSGTWCER